MAVLTIWQNNICRQISFSGTPKLSALLLQHGIQAPHPCGGRGVCKKCAIRAEGAVSAPAPAEAAAGTRLSCQITLLGNAQIWLSEDTGTVETGGSAAQLGNTMGRHFGAAVDVGTTTVALKLYNLKTGDLLAREGILNPQRSVAADVMGRIGSAMDGNLSRLQAMASDAIEKLLDSCCSRSGIAKKDVDAMVVTGNTTMLYLLTGRNPSCLSAAPFQADCLFDRADCLLGIPVYYPPCISAFLGGDILCALLDSRIHRKHQKALLCDIGTNGELALWKDGSLYVTSTAAGPAFEGAGISCGCGSIPGAIDRVWVENGSIRVHTIDQQPAAGLCGSGLVDAVAAFLETGDVDETGAVEAACLPLTETVSLLPADIRAVQLAKGAIAAGIRTLLEMAGTEEEEVEALYIAGGFGSHLNVASAGAIGLIPGALQSKVQVLGNAALSGAARLLLDRNLIAEARELAKTAVAVPLSGNSRFSRYFMEAMLFCDDLME